MESSGQRLRFGTFLPPLHRLGIDPTLAIQRDIELARHLDQLGYDEIWYGEHHSGGVELGCSPAIAIAAAAQHTQRIKLGTGVVSLPFHNPFIVADEIMLLDHLTRGRAMFGVGPGQLLADASMIGIDPATERARMQEALDVILRLFAGDTVTAKSEWFDLREATLQLPRYSDFEVCVTGAISASGPALAGRYGTGLLSLAATDPKGCELLSSHWDIVETEAKEHGHTPDRSRWRLVGPMHLAETVEQAREDVLYGMPWLVQYLSHVSPANLTAVKNSEDPYAIIDAMNASGRGVVGTPDMAVEQLTRLVEKSGGFGTYLFLGADYARWRPTLRSYELFAEEVMPRINGKIAKLQQSVDRVLSSYDGADATARAQAQATQDYEQSRAAHR